MEPLRLSEFPHILLSCRSVVAGGFSSIMAYGLSRIRVHHLSGWRWILVRRVLPRSTDYIMMHEQIIEGLITCLLSILGYFSMC